MERHGSSVRDSLRRVLAPAQPIAEIMDMSVLLVSVELWTRAVVLRFAAVLTERSDRLDAEHDAAMQKWARLGCSGDPPEHPGGSLYEGVVLRDDLGTRYRPSWSSRGGTGTEWRSEWWFVPGVPEQATVLRVAVRDHQDRSHEAELRL